MSCDHKWVMYQPFTGEAYECCANAGCGIRKDEYDKTIQMTFDDLRVTSRDDLPSGRRYVIDEQDTALDYWTPWMGSGPRGSGPGGDSKI